MPVLELLAQRDGKADAQAANEVFVLVAVKDKRMHHADAVHPGVKVQANDERQPGAAPESAVWRPVILTTARTGPDCSSVTTSIWLVKLFLAQYAPGCRTGTGLPAGRQAALPRDDPPADGERVNQIWRRVWGMRQAMSPVWISMASAVWLTCSGAAGAARVVPGRRGCAERAARQSRRADGGVAGPLQRAIRPVGQRPGLHGKDVSPWHRSGGRLSPASTVPRGQGTPQLTPCGWSGMAGSSQCSATGPAGPPKRVRRTIGDRAAGLPRACFPVTFISYAPAFSTARRTSRMTPQWPSSRRSQQSLCGPFGELPVRTGKHLGVVEAMRLRVTELRPALHPIPASARPAVFILA